MTSKVSLLILFAVFVTSLSLSHAVRTWKPEDSLNTVYWSFSASCNLALLRNFSCGFCKKAPPATFIGSMSHRASDTFGYVFVTGNQVPYPRIPGARVHRGFLNAYNFVANQTKFIIDEALLKCPSCTKVHFVGHSLGGALTVHAAVDFLLSKQVRPVTVALGTLGMPRVGNPAFAHFLDSKLNESWRLTHNRDPFVHLPPVIPVIGFDVRHVATEIWEKDGIYKQCSGGEDPTCSASIGFPYNFDDHEVYMGIHSEDERDCVIDQHDCSSSPRKSPSELRNLYDQKMSQLSLEIASRQRKQFKFNI